MPTLELLNRIKSRPNLPNVTKYGFNTEFFREFDDIVGTLDQSNSEEGLNVKARLLRTGGCPNELRVYHAICGTSWKLGTRDDRIEDLLGEESDISRGRAGMLFEDWIDTANEAMNEWLETEDDGVFIDRDIPSPIARFYLSRLDNIKDLCTEIGVDLNSVKMDTQYRIDAETLGESNPDGVWPYVGNGDYPGGVFESKLAVPHEKGIESELTGYAVHYEREQSYPIEFGIVLYLDEGQNEIRVEGVHLDDRSRDQVKENIQKFSNLIFRSKLEASWEEESELDDWVIKPELPSYSHECRSCPYEWTCQSQRHYSAYQSVPRNLKLSGHKLGAALQAIAEGEPNRSQVIHEAMKIFPDDVSEKSGFRGMVAPTTEKLGFARSMRNGQVFFLSPNGKASIYGDSVNDAVIGKCIRDICHLEFGLYEEAVAYFEKLSDNIRDGDERLYKNLRRFINQFLDEFDVELPKLADHREAGIEALYKNDPEIKYLNERDQRRRWIRASLPEKQQKQIEEVRWKMLRTLLASDLIASYWFVDEAIWREWGEHDSIIELYEGSTFRETQLIRENTPYDGVLVREGPG